MPLGELGEGFAGGDVHPGEQVDGAGAAVAGTARPRPDSSAEPLRLRRSRPVWPSSGFSTGWSHPRAARDGSLAAPLRPGPPVTMASGPVPVAITQTPAGPARRTGLAARAPHQCAVQRRAIS